MSQNLAKPGIGHNISPALANANPKREAAAHYDDGLLAVAGRIMILCYAGALAITAFTFFGSGEALYVVAVSIALALMYFTLPVLMGRVRATHDQRWQSDSAHRTSAMVDLWRGPSAVGKRLCRSSAFRSQCFSPTQHFRRSGL